MSNEQTTEAPASTEPEVVDATAAPATTETIAPNADQETSAASEQTTEQVEQPTQPTDDTAPPAQETAPVDDVVARIVPEVGDYVLPEGVPEAMAQFAKDADMTQDQLDQSLAQFGHIVQSTEQGRQDAIRQNGLAHVETWGKQKDYNLSLVRRALSQNDPDGKLRGMLDESGYGNHPAVLDFFLKIGNSMREGGFLKGSNNTQSKQGLSAAQSMFGANHPSNN